MMKKYSIILSLFSITIFAQNVGIGTASPETVLDIRSNNSGILLPRISSSVDISSPDTGEMYYDTTERCIKIYKNNRWEGLNCSTFQNVASYNGISLYDNGDSRIGKEGAAYYGEPMPSSSTITVAVQFTSPSTYRYEAIDPVTGIRYFAEGYSEMGSHNIILSNNGVIPLTIGNLPMILKGGLNDLAILPRIDFRPNASTTWVEGVDFQPVTVGTMVWMDRNLGAKRAATSLTDVLAQGNPFQWGRKMDGHQEVAISGMNFNLGESFYGQTVTRQDPLNSGNQFVTTNSSTNWMNPNNNTLWAGVNAVNNPCPTGYRVPTSTEFTALFSALGIVDVVTAFNSPMKFPLANERPAPDGIIYGNTSAYRMWASDNFTGAFARFAAINAASVNAGSAGLLKSFGLQLRCIKN